MPRRLGVRYLHGEANQAPPAALPPATLEVSPGDLYQDLADALLRLDPGPVAAFDAQRSYGNGDTGGTP
jgi:hypothetical protein